MAPQDKMDNRVSLAKQEMRAHLDGKETRGTRGPVGSLVLQGPKETGDLRAQKAHRDHLDQTVKRVMSGIPVRLEILDPKERRVRWDL